jgi:tetratricopeptide (TPR) repeat protein
MEPVHHIGDTTQDILSAIGTFVTVYDGVVSFRYPALRQHLITVASAVTDFTNKGGFPFHLKEAHYDIVTRCLAYVKFHVQDDLEVSSITVSPSTQNHFFDRYELLEYTARYWPAHFSLSPMVEGKDTFKLTATFKQCLPDSILLALLETSTQQTQFSLHTAEEFLSLSIKLRRLLFKDVSQSLLQSLVLQGRLTHTLGLRTSVDYLYESWVLSEKLLGSQSSVVKATSELFMQSMTKVDIKETTIIKKETILRYLIERTKEERGISHDLTIKYTRSLVQLYIDVKNIEAATTVCKELYELSITRYGRFSSETQETTDIFFEQLQSFGNSEFVSEVMQTRHEYNIQHLEVTDERRITSTISSVEVFEQRGEITRAESSLFELWQSLSSVEQTSESVIKQQVDVTLKYSEFLTKHGRKDEAESIVSGMWVSLQQQSYRFESLSSTIEKFTSHIKTQKWYSLAESALSSLWSQYKSEKHTSSSSTVAVASALSEIVQESITTTRSSTSSRSSSSTTVQTHQQFELLREVFETASQPTSVSRKSIATTTQMAETIAESYVQQGNYEKAIEVHQRAMQSIWSGIESKTSVIKLTSETTRVARQAINLAQVYFKNLQIEKASTVYENTFKSVISSVSVKDELFTIVTKDAISFYENTYQFSKVISMYQEIYKVLSTQIGKADERTIQTLYSWGDRAIKYHQEAEAEKAYYEIFVAFDKKEFLDVRSIRAARALCTIYESSKRWKEAQQVYELLWKSITLHGQELCIESEEIEAIYSRYSSLLETRMKADITVIHSLATSYREICLKIYGESHVSTYKATMRLAEISHSSEKYQKESLSLYEYALKMSSKFSSTVDTREVTESSTTTTTSTTSIIKQRLAKLYSSSTETVAKAVSLYQEDYNSSVKQEGYTSQASLTALQELVTSYHKQNTKSSTTEAVKTLTTATASIFEQETDSQRMYKSSQAIAQMYKTIGHQEAAWTPLQSFRSRLIRETISTEKTTVSRKVAVFIVAFEESLFQKRTYTAIMAELVSEINLYESFYTARKEKEFLAIFISGVRLLNFQRTRNATEELQNTDTEMFRLFTEHFSVKSQSSKVSIQAFYQITIAEITKREYDTLIIAKTVRAVHHEIEQGHFQEAYELSSILHKFIQQADGFSTHSNTKEGILLAKYLLGHGVKKSPDAKLVKAMSELSRIVLQDILIMYRATGVRFTDLDVSEINEITILLGEQKNFEDLEESRHPPV